MIRIITFSILILQLLLTQSAFAQLDSIIDQSVYRTFIVHLPLSYSSGNQYPLVINLHGLNSNAAQQEIYSQFDNVADTEKFIVVYPNAISGSWIINGTNDVDFISHLIDTVRSKYSCNNCLFITGMSQGGFMAYKLACSLPQPIEAVAVVSGNMSQNLQNTCTISGGLPVMHFHGTSDPLVKYNGTFGIPPVETTINWWVNQNNSISNPIFTSIPDINFSDSSTVEKYEYAGGSNGREMTFYKIINGGHTWPGGPPVPPFGFTNMDINASQIIGGFFRQYCSAMTAIDESVSEKPKVYPNPFFSNIYLENASGNEFFKLTGFSGQTIWSGTSIEVQDFSTLCNGLYFLKITNSTVQQTIKLIKQ